MRPGEIDWNTISTEYITTGIGLREIARKYGVGMGTVSRRSKADGWVEKRDRYRDRCIAEVVRNEQEKEVNRLSKLMDATVRAIDVVMEAVEDEDQFHRHIVTTSTGLGLTDVQEQVYKKVDTKALKDFTGILKDLTGLMRDFYNIPTAAQAEAQRIAAERLEIEKKKADADSAGDVSVEVRFEDDDADRYSR